MTESFQNKLRHCDGARRALHVGDDEVMMKCASHSLSIPTFGSVSRTPLGSSRGCVRQLLRFGPLNQRDSFPLAPPPPCVQHASLLQHFIV